MVAIVPAAGKGSRMAEVTKGRPKELLQLGGVPLLTRVIEEARSAGIERIFVVSSRDKAEISKVLPPDVAMVYQEMPNGHGAAVAEVKCVESAVVLNPDTVYYPRSPTSRIVKALRSGADVVLPVQLVEDSEVARYGIVERNRDSGAIERILEKPDPGQTTSRWAIAGRFGLSSGAQLFLQNQLEKSAESCDIALTPVLAMAIESGLSGISLSLAADERRLDCGSPEGYREAVALLGR